MPLSKILGALFNNVMQMKYAGLIMWLFLGALMYILMQMRYLALCGRRALKIFTFLYKIKRKDKKNIVYT